MVGAVVTFGQGVLPSFLDVVVDLDGGVVGRLIIQFIWEFRVTLLHSTISIEYIAHHCLHQRIEVVSELCRAFFKGCFLLGVKLMIEVIM